MIMVKRKQENREDEDMGEFWKSPQKIEIKYVASMTTQSLVKLEIAVMLLSTHFILVRLSRRTERKSVDIGTARLFFRNQHD